MPGLVRYIRRLGQKESPLLRKGLVVQREPEQGQIQPTGVPLTPGEVARRDARRANMHQFQPERYASPAYRAAEGARADAADYASREEAHRRAQLASDPNVYSDSEDQRVEKNEKAKSEEKLRAAEYRKQLKAYLGEK